MPWNLEIMFSGLCSFVPKPIKQQSSEETFQGVLLVRTGEAAPCEPDPHKPLLTFRPEDLGDSSGEVAASYRPTFRLVPDANANQLACVDLLDCEIGLEFHNNQPTNLKTVAKGVGDDQQKPANEGQADDFKWVLNLQEMGADGLHDDCFVYAWQSKSVAARMKLDKGELSTHRLGMRPGLKDYSLWEFYPPPPQRRLLIRALADKTTLRFRNLTDVVTLELKKADQAGSPQVVQYFQFPRDLEAPSTVTLSISNLPEFPQVSDADVLLHFRAFYNLVTRNGSIDCAAERPAPKLWLEDKAGGVSGASVFCPDTQVTLG